MDGVEDDIDCGAAAMFIPFVPTADDGDIDIDFAVGIFPMATVAVAAFVVPLSPARPDNDVDDLAVVISPPATRGGAAAVVVVAVVPLGPTCAARCRKVHNLLRRIPIRRGGGSNSTLRC